MNAGNVFRAYDIRGVVDKDFNAEWVTHLGKACGTYLAGRGISSAVIGYDCRHSSPAYHDALVEGILSTGTDVISIGMVPTPALYFAVKHLNRQGGVMITASHNPPEYNGFKVWAGQSTIHGEEIQKIKAIFEEGAFAEGTGTASRIDIIPTYKQDILSRFKLARPVKVVLDGGNGAGGEICADILQTRRNGHPHVLRAGRRFPQPPPRSRRRGQHAGAHGPREGRKGRSRHRAGW